MAFKYGFLKSDSDLQSKASTVIEKKENVYAVDEIDRVYKELKQEIDSEKNLFLKNFNFEIDKIKANLENLEVEISTIETNYRTKLNNLKHKNSFQKFLNKFKKQKIELFYKNNLNKNLKLKEKCNAKLLKYKNNPEQVFLESHKVVLNKINFLEILKKDPLYLKAKNEINIFNELNKLSDDSHILCGVLIPCSKQKKEVINVFYNFVVVNRRGLFLINIEGYDDKTLKNYLTNRRLLDVFLKLKLDRKDLALTQTRLKPILISNSDEISEDGLLTKTKYYKVNTFIESQPICFYDAEVSSLVYFLRNYVSK